MWVRQSTAIIVLAIAGAVIYGILHDEITARICIEYFTIGHPPVFATDDPTLLGLGWGVIATWWVGLILGVLLAGSAQFGSWPRVAVGQFYRPLFVTLLCVGVVATLAGVVGHVAATRGWVYLVGPIVERLPAHRHVAFLTDLWTHLASYTGGAIGGLALCIWVLVRRKRAAVRVLT